MSSIKANGISIEYDTFGDESNKPLLMVMGLGRQMIAWDPDFCNMLAGKGHFVIRFDNRDVGLSSYFGEHGVPDMGQLAMELAAGTIPAVAYTLDDMAADSIALLSALGIDQAHICGVSLGGMIVQTMAINYPQRVLSMTSIMSTTGNAELPPASPEAMAVLSAQSVDDIEHILQQSLEASKIIGSPGFPHDEKRIRDKGLEAYNRAYYPQGIARQMAAAMVQADRRVGLNQLNIPSLVIHGKDDPLVPLTGGLDTQANIPNAKLIVIDGMGHDLPVGAWTQIVDGISELTA